MDKKKRWTLGILLVILGLLGAGAGIFGGRSREEEKLSLIYIPKIIDETNDFWRLFWREPGRRQRNTECIWK